MTIQQVLSILGYWAIWDFSDRKVRLVVYCTGIVLFAGTVDDVWNWLEVTRQYKRDGK